MTPLSTSPPVATATPLAQGRQPAPQSCIDLWNTGAENAPLIATHFYAAHNVRQVWVFLWKDPQANERCVVVFALAETDFEFGLGGYVYDPLGGWVPMYQVQDLGEPLTIQRAALTHANASLAEAGTLAPLF